MAPSYAISVLLDDDLLTFNRVIGVVRRRNVPIAGFAMGATQAPGVARLTFVMQADDASADRLVQQLRKSFGVRAAVMFPAGDAVTREIALIKVRAPADRAELLAVVSQCEAAVVDGDFAMLENSIRQQIYSLPDTTLVYPGHGPRTSVAREKSNNPYVHG